MLRQLRSGRNMKAIMLTVAVTFVIGFTLLSVDPFGGNSGGGPESLAAVINGVDVPYGLYQQRISEFADSERQRVQRDELLAADYERIEQQVWDGLIDEIIMTQEAEKLGLQARDTEIIGTLTTNPPAYVQQRFRKEDGQFDPEAFQRAINDPSYPWLRDEMYLRAILPSLKLSEMVRARAAVGEEEVRREFARRTLKNTVEYVGTSWAELQLETEPSDAELRTYYDAHATEFASGETVVLELLRLDKSPSAEDDQELLSEGRGILRELADGSIENFARLAEYYSDDPSASQGGSLGWMRQNALPEPVGRAVWQLQPGMRTEPIITDRGLYIVQVDSMRTASDGDRELNLRTLFLESQASGATLDSVRTLAFNVADAAKKDFAAAGRKFKLDIERLNPVEKSGFFPGFGFSLRLRDWAFAASPGDVGGPFSTDASIAMVRLAEKIASQPKPFEQVQARVQSNWIEQEKKRRARAAVEVCAARLAAGNSLADAAKAANLTLNRPEPFSYYDAVPDVGGANEFTAIAAQLAPGQTSAVFETARGAYLVHLIGRDAFNEEIYQRERAAHAQGAFARRASEAFDAWMQQLRSKAEVVDKRGPRV